MRDAPFGSYGTDIPFGQHQESRPGQVQHRKSAIHGLHVTLRMLRVKCDKFDWFWSQSIVFRKPFITGRDGSAPRSMGVISPNRRETRVTKTWYLRLLRVRVRVTWSQDNVIRVNMLIRVPSRHVTTHASSNMRIMKAR